MTNLVAASTVSKFQ